MAGLAAAPPMLAPGLSGALIWRGVQGGSPNQPLAIHDRTVAGVTPTSRAAAAIEDTLFTATSPSPACSARTDADLAHPHQDELLPVICRS